MTQNPIKAIEGALAANSKQFASLLPPHIPPAKFMRTVVGAVQSNPAIMQCSTESVISSCKKAAQDGLIIDGREAALVPFKGTAQYMPMLAGMLKKLRNSGELSTITAQIVCRNDPFKFNPAMDEVPNHSPDWFGDRGDMIGVYAVARMKDGSSICEIMNLQEIEKVRAVSRSAQKGPWVDWYEEMAKKTVIRRLCKYLPSSADIDQMLDHDSESIEKPAQSKSAHLSKVINGTAERVNEPVSQQEQQANLNLEDAF